MEIWIVTAILIATLYLLVSERLPIDMTAIGIMVALMVTGVLSPTEAVAGFANPAVITVGAMFLLSRGLIRTGGVDFVTQKVLVWSKGNKHLAYLYVLAAVALASAFIPVVFAARLNFV